MGGSIIFFFLCGLFVVSFQEESRAAQAGNNNGVYIVYMGASASRDGSLRNDQVQLINSVLRRNGNAVIQTYKHGFSGFAARMSEDDARSIAQKPGVVSVFPDPLLQLHTTRSWDFLMYETAPEVDSQPTPASDSSSPESADTIIGILDTGIWPESESFSDKDMGPIPSRWRGKCMGADDFSSSNCNRKLIGAKFYEGPDYPKVATTRSARDAQGHGTHVASTAAGSTVANASFKGLAAGTARGGSPGSRIAVYRVCFITGCLGSSVLAAFDDAIADGVDVLSLSLGAPADLSPPLESDPIAIGSFHAVDHGITVVCAAGNDGPSLRTVVNVAPWILTVAASTMDRDFQSNLVLGGNKVIKGHGINFSSLKKTPSYPLIYAKDAKKRGANKDTARHCYSDSLDKKLIKGKIVICDTGSDYWVSEMIDVVKSLGGIGTVLIVNKSDTVANSYDAFPVTEVLSKDAAEIFAYKNSTRKPIATILPTVSVTKYKPAPVIADFSSRGPSYYNRNILKPDISAPGVDVLAAWIPDKSLPQGFALVSGTSMACPHVSGIVAMVKSRHPTWSPSAIRSAIMTTATQKNNLKAPITTDSDSIATAYDYGAGEVTTSGPLEPGLVYETSPVDYFNYLCYSGRSISAIVGVIKTVPDGFACPEDSKPEYISGINYPSIAISNFNGKESKNVSRTATNVAGDGETVYTVVVDAPVGVNVKVIPDKLQFTKDNEKQSYQVIFDSSTGTRLKEDAFGSITWSNGKYKVRSTLVISSDQ